MPDSLSDATDSHRRTTDSPGHTTASPRQMADSLRRLAGGQRGRTVARISARAFLFDDDGRLVLLRRTRSGQAPYWTTAGGGVEDSDDSVEAAMYRELREELGAEVSGASQVLLFSFPAREGLAIAHFFVARLVRMDLAARSGPEFADPSRGAYDPDRFDLLGDELEAIDLRPPEIKQFILANREALLAEAGLLA